MKKLLTLLAVLAPLAVFGQQAVTLTVNLTSEQVWALTMDWNDYRAASTNNTLTKLQWFQSNATNQIIAAANRRVDIRSQQLAQIIAQRWSTLTPAEKTNVLNALPAQ